MIIVVEGPNNVGKTTFINKFVEKHPNFKVIHTDGTTPNDYDFYVHCLSKQFDNNVNIIYDRLHVGETIYPKLYNREARLTIQEYNELCESYKDVIYVFIDADMKFKRHAFANKNEKINLYEVEVEKSLFKRRYDKLKFTNNVYFMYNTLDTINDNIEILIDELTKDININIQNNNLIKGYSEDCGVDILLQEDVSFEPKSLKVVDLKLVITPCEGTASFLIPRTSAAIKGIYVASCPIDANYCGTINAIVYNMSNEKIVYKKGESFCQVVTLPILSPNCKYKIKKAGKRNYGKFGSTDSRG